MLDIAYKRVTLFPVGYVGFLYMNSLDFEEFYWINGITALEVKSADNTKSKPLNSVMTNRGVK